VSRNSPRLTFDHRDFGVCFPRDSTVGLAIFARSDLPIVREGEIAEKTVGRTPERSGRAWTLRGREKEKVLVE
jgi:hypothetical protein